MNGGFGPHSLFVHSSLWYDTPMKSDTGTHYSLAFSQRMAHFTSAAKSLILKHFKNENVLLHFRGFSGAAHGLAVYHALLNTDKSILGTTRIEAMFSRKSGDTDNHGRLTEVSTQSKFIPSVCLFVDDFISSGDTMRKSLTVVKRYLTARKIRHRDVGWFALVGADINCTELTTTEVLLDKIKYSAEYRSFENLPFDKVVISD